MIAEPSKVPKKGLIQVKFKSDFAPFKVKAGEIRYVSMRAATNLWKQWGVIDKPEPPEHKPEEPQNQKKAVIPVQVLDNEAGRALMKKYGHDWYPGSVHLVDAGNVELVKNMLDLGAAKIYIDNASISGESDGNEPLDDGSTFYTTYPKPDFRSYAAQWFTSHPDWKGCTVDMAVRCIELADQCDPNSAIDILLEIERNGHITIQSDGTVIW